MGRGFAVKQASVRAKPRTMYCQHQELAMDAGRAPLLVFLAHPLDEITQATIDLRPPCPLSGFPAPESFEARAMPPEDGLRLNHLGHPEQARLGADDSDLAELHPARFYPA
jgi:hypothetical protein